MRHPYDPIVDANINRVCEGLRVLEDFARFTASQKEMAQTLAQLRHTISHSSPNPVGQLASRDSEKDVRAKETPARRQSTQALLTANFKRVTEGLRVLEEVTGNAQFNAWRYDLYTLEKELVLRQLKKPFATPGIYLISHDIAILKRGIEWGVSLVQLRPRAEDLKSQLLQDARELKEWTRQTDTALIVNDHLDVALLSDADGFHSGQDALAISELRKILGPHKIVGRTTHSLEQGKIAAAEGADYVSVGPIWETPSKPGRPAIGFDYLSEAATLSIPYVAIGGIDAARFDEILHYSPPLIGLVRDYAKVPELLSKLKASVC